MRTLTKREYHQWIDNAQVLSRDPHEDKVLELADGRIVKLFRRKRLLSSALWRPYAVRFAAAASRLKSLGVETVNVIEVCRVPHISRHAVVYEKLAGVPLREALKDDDISIDQLWRAFARFLASLHECGVYFRAIHFANVLVTGEDRFGLIDVSEARFYRGPLRPGLRARNFKPMMKYAEDAQALRDFGFENLIGLYLSHANLAPAARRRFLAAIERSVLHRPPQCGAIDDAHAAQPRLD